MNLNQRGAVNKRMILIPVAFLAVCAIGYMIYEHLVYVSTDNAQIQANTLMISPKVTGYILKVNVKENQSVKSGDVLAEIDSKDYANTLLQVQSDLDSVQARYRDAEKNFKRVVELFKTGAVSQQQYDNSEASYREVKSKLASLQAQVTQAKLNVDYTLLKAPFDGVIAKKSVEIGMLAPVGTPLFGFVSSEERWVAANFKETELASIKIGNHAEVTVDAVPGRTFTGEVESISPSTGSTFTLLPPDNSTGNFTKVVQRVPVRIRLLNLDAAAIEALKAGLSADVKVRIK